MAYRRRFSAFVTKDSNPGSAIRHALQFARDFMAQHSFEPRLQVKLAILVEELVTNALCHGGRSQDISLSMELGAAESAVRVEIKDDGPPFDPLSAAPITEPDPMTGGGIGLAIVHAWAESPTYMWQSDQNTLALMLR